jgi:hypothetical protein
MLSLTVYNYHPGCLIKNNVDGIEMVYITQKTYRKMTSDK